jgi:hypothetical protein
MMGPVSKSDHCPVFTCCEAKPVIDMNCVGAEFLPRQARQPIAAALNGTSDKFW